MPTATSVALEEFTKNYSSWLQVAGISEGDLREIVRREMLFSRAQRALQDRIPASTDQVHIRHIQAADQDTAKSILERAKAIDFATNPDGFAELAREVTEDALSKDEGGDLGWSLRELLIDDYGEAFADAAFALYTPGSLSGVVEGANGWHIIQLVERDPERPIDGDQWDTLWNRALSLWLERQKETAQIERYWSSDKVPPSGGFLGQ
jgi:parvulin-like peptidyl-prolyl isomerase